MSLEIYLIRHAESEMNLRPELIGGRSNQSKVTDNGQAQAVALGESLKNQRLTFDAAYSSPAIRALLTAEYSLDYAGDSLKIKIDSRLQELSQGDWEGISREQIYRRHNVLTGLAGDNWNFVPGDKVKGESQAMVAERMASWFDEIIKTYKEGKIVAFTHGMVIKTLLAKKLNLERASVYKRQIGNTGVTILEYNPNLLKLIKNNDCTHLEK